MLVAGAAALLVSLAFSLVSTSMQSTWTDAVTADPIRILPAIIIGVSLLGGGTIFRDRSGRQVVQRETRGGVVESVREVPRGFDDDHLEGRPTTASSRWPPRALPSLHPSTMCACSAASPFLRPMLPASVSTSTCSSTIIFV